MLLFLAPSAFRIPISLVLSTTLTSMIFITPTPATKRDIPAIPPSMPLIMAICSSMGFAYVVTTTGCDKNLVKFLAAPLNKLGILLIPATTIITSFINVAIPSASGCAAAVGATFVLMGTFGSNISPGTSHNSVVAKIANMDMMDLISLHTPYSIAMVLIGAVGLTIVCLILRDNKPTAKELEDYYTSADHSGGIERINPLKAIAPLVPLVILLLGNSYVPVIKMGVAQAMVIGAIFALIVSWVNPQQFTKDFFKGMGEGYGSVMGIIITAGVFAAGLKATGLIDAFVEVLKSSNEIARWGGSFGPFIMAAITGSGDAATFAFNEAVTPHAASFGMPIPNLGAMALISGQMGRTMSPIAGVVIVLSGLAMVPPIQLVKRTAIPLIVGVVVLALTIV